MWLWINNIFGSRLEKFVVLWYNKKRCVLTYIRKKENCEGQL